GMLFSCTGQDIRHKFIDVSHQAVKSNYVPISVGLRSQALKLRFVSPDTEGFFLKPTQTFEKVVQTFEQRFSRTLPKPILHQSRIGQTVSLIYSPFYVEDKLYDAVLNQPISSSLPNDFDLDHMPGGAPDWRIRFISALCPHCGWDLAGKIDSLVLICKNCNSAWYPAGKTLKKLKFGKYPLESDDALYLPFWRIRADISEITLNTYADLIKVANIPKVAQSKWADIGFRFWSPAFKVRPKVFLRLSNNLTLTQPREKLSTKLPLTKIHPITLPVTEAIESLKINLASFMKPKTFLTDTLQKIKISAKSFALVYVPFLEKHHEFIQPDLQIAINKNLLALASNL
ncbi:MAG: hypothetical protein ACE5HX_12155, partial [bacterium]